MSYLVLARKWRPTTFDEVVGQGHVTQTLKNALELNRVAHALLFTGSRGIGKTSCARILAKALNCAEGPTVHPCGVCNFCVEITQGTSVDVFEIDGASNNSVEQIREIRESVKFVPASGRRKVYIIDEVHMLSTSAFNALLKTLEEPPEHVLFIFATTEPHKIPDTIISRCQRYDFKRIGEGEIVAALQRIAQAEDIEVEPTALAHIAREANGGMRDSLSLLDQVIAFSGLQISETAVRDVLGIAGRTVLKSLVDSILSGDGQSALQLIDAQHRRGLDLTKFTGELVRYVRDLMVIRVCPEPGQLVDIPSDELETVQEWVNQISPSTLHRILNKLIAGADEIARSSFPKLVLEMTILGMCHQGTTMPLTEVLTGLKNLEVKLAQSGITPTGDLVSDHASIDAPLTPDQSAPIKSSFDDVHRASGENVPQDTTIGYTDQAPPTQMPVHNEPLEASDIAEPALAEEGSAVPQASSQDVSPGNSEPVESSILASEPEPEHPPWEEGPAVPTPISAQPPEAIIESRPPVAPVAEQTKALDAPSQASERSSGGDGFKKRPNEGEYDDFSGGPPTPHTVENLRPLAVKPRISAAISQADVDKFLDHSRPSHLVNSAQASTDRSPKTSTAVDTGNSGSESHSSSETIEGDGDDGVPIDFQDGRTDVEYLDEVLSRVRKIDVFAASEMVQILYPIEVNTRRVMVAIDATQPEGLVDTCRGHIQGVLDRNGTGSIELEIVLCEPGDPRLQVETVYARQRRLDQEARDYRKECVRTDETVLQATDILGGELIDVKLRVLDEAPQG